MLLDGGFGSEIAKELAIAMRTFNQNPSMLKPGSQASKAYKAKILEPSKIIIPKNAQPQLRKMTPPPIIRVPIVEIAITVNHNKMVARARVPKSLIMICSGNSCDDTHKTRPESIRFMIRYTNRLIFCTSLKYRRLFLIITQVV